MKLPIDIEYVTIHYEPGYKIVIMKWLPVCDRMSELEFHGQLSRLFEMATLYKTWIIYIDASDFNYPILDNSVDHINNYLKNCPVKDFRIVKSKHIIGVSGVSKLIQKANCPRIKLKIFESGEEGENWLKSYHELLAID